MTGIQNILYRLQGGEIIELVDENQTLTCLQYRIEDNAYVIYDKGSRSIIYEDTEIENLIRSHFQGKDGIQQ